MIWVTMSAWTIGSAVLAWLLWKHFPGPDGQTLAAWFQAVGSIAAIVVAFLIGREQSKAALRAVTEAQRERRGSIVAVAGAAAAHARTIKDVLDLGDDPGHARMYNVYDKSIVDGLVHALTSTPAHEVGSADDVMALLALRDQCVFLGVQMEKYLGGPRRIPEFVREIEACADNVEYQRIVIEGQKTVLVHNVRVHLEQIQHHYSKLKVVERA